MKLLHGLAAWALLAPLAGTGAEAEELHGFLLGGFSARVTGEKTKPASGDFLRGEERLQLRFAGSNERGSGYFAKVDFFHDAISSKADTDVREAYLSHPAGAFDFTVGRQIFTWGVGDLLFINDVFPKDYTALFSGQPIEYLKRGTTGFKTTLTTGIVSADIIIMPFFEPNRLPGGDRYFFHDPFSALTNRVDDSPRHDLANTEFAFRLFRPILGWDAAVYAYRGFFRDPSMQPDAMTAPSQITFTYPKVDVYGASLQGNALGGVVSLETGYLDSHADRAGTNPLIPNPQTKYLVGYQRSFWADFTAGFQYYGEYMGQYDSYHANVPVGFPLQDRLRHVAALRLTQFLKYQTWRLSWFSFCSPSDRDFYFIPEVSYRVADELLVALGGNIFGGAKTTTFLGQFRKNNNVYVNLRYDF